MAVPPGKKRLTNTSPSSPSAITTDDALPATASKRPGTTGLVFWLSIGIVLLSLVGAIASGRDGGVATRGLLRQLLGGFGWFYTSTVNLCLLACVVLAVTRKGRIRLGKDHERPEFSTFSWLAMVFSAGMGIGLVFYGAAEPLLHYVDPQGAVDGLTKAAARSSLAWSIFHWGFHAWCIYAVLGLTVAYFSFRHDEPYLISSPLHALRPGTPARAPVLQLVDALAVFATLFGLATSLGLGAIQINAGLTHAFGVPESGIVQSGLIALMTAGATVSVVLGIGAGVRRLSEFNTVLALLFLVFVFFAGPTLFLLGTIPKNAQSYAAVFGRMTFTSDAFELDAWHEQWTLFYWGWWLAWAPFVGLFLARVSRGRTIREFILGIVIVPTVVTLIWLTVFGNTAIALDSQSGGELTDMVQQSVPRALYTMLDHLPLSGLSAFAATVLIATFFISSSDSGSLVVDMLTSNGHLEPPRWKRIFWALAEGAIGITLLLAGGLRALQNAAILAGFPLAFLTILMLVSLFIALRRESSVPGTHAS